MPRLRRLSSREVIRILSRFGFRAYSQRGSHIKLRRQSPGGGTQVLIVPHRREIETGTLRTIYRQARQYIPEEELREFFYTD